MKRRFNVLFCLDGFLVVNASHPPYSSRECSASGYSPVGSRPSGCRRRSVSVHNSRGGRSQTLLPPRIKHCPYTIERPPPSEFLDICQTQVLSTTSPFPHNSSSSCLSSSSLDIQQRGVLDLRPVEKLANLAIFRKPLRLRKLLDVILHARPPREHDEFLALAVRLDIDPPPRDHLATATNKVIQIAPIRTKRTLQPAPLLRTRHEQPPDRDDGRADDLRQRRHVLVEGDVEEELDDDLVLEEREQALVRRAGHEGVHVGGDRGPGADDVEQGRVFDALVVVERGARGGLHGGAGEGEVLAERWVGDGGGGLETHEGEFGYRHGCLRQAVWRGRQEGDLGWEALSIEGTEGRFWKY